MTSKFEPDGEACMLTAGPLADPGSFLPLECRIGIDSDDAAAVAALCFRRT